MFSSKKTRDVVFYKQFLIIKQYFMRDVLSIDIDEVLRINDKDYSITFSTYFNVEWTERRLWVDPELIARQNNTEPKAPVSKTHNPVFECR